MSRTLSAFALTAALSASTITACTEPAAPPPESLAEVTVPADFTFATTKPVALSVSATADKLGGGQGAIAVERVDGKVLFRGPIEAGKPLQVKLMVPSKDDDLKLKLFAKGGELTAQVAVASGSATHTFE
ncbi:hypothetical protein L6R52_21805 [Myxococcota bacterium]|nr:hypothetical protein [Myxococcota bacterium]